MVHNWKRLANTVWKCQACSLEVVTAPGKGPPPDSIGECCRKAPASGEHCWRPSGNQFTCCRCRAARASAEAAGLFGCAVETDRCNGEQLVAGAK